MEVARSNRAKGIPAEFASVPDWQMALVATEMIDGSIPSNGSNGQDPRTGRNMKNKYKLIVRIGIGFIFVIIVYFVVIYPIAPPPHWPAYEQFLMRRAVKTARQDKGDMQQNSWSKNNLDGTDMSYVKFHHASFGYTWLRNANLSHSDRYRSGVSRQG